jgi:hypothetical protein
LKYPIPAIVAAQVFFAIFLQRRISFRCHALRLLAGLEPPPKILGFQNIPQNGPCVITVNHYSRPGFSAMWLGIGISALVPWEVCWCMTSAWTYAGMPLQRIRSFISRTFLTAIAGVYDFISMPPISNEPHQLQEGTRAIRAIFNYARNNPQGILAFAPEGRDIPGGILGMPPPGTGKLALTLARRGFMFCPVGGYEENGVFTLAFGKSYELSLLTSQPNDMIDRKASRQMMTAIAACLPRELRGEFDSEVTSLP